VLSHAVERKGEAKWGYSVIADSLAEGSRNRAAGSRNSQEGSTSAAGLRTRAALRAITVGGLTAGALDLTQACVLFGGNIPRVIAAGLLGPKAIHGGAGTYVLGVLLHFFIAFSFAAFYYAASRRLVFLTEHPLVCGLVYGAAVEEVMNLIVLPLSALHSKGPYELHDLIQGLLVHMFVVGLPISFSVRRFARAA
jgi:hypothetical protein